MPRNWQEESKSFGYSLCIKAVPRGSAARSFEQFIVDAVACLGGACAGWCLSVATAKRVLLTHLIIGLLRRKVEQVREVGNNRQPSVRPRLQIHSSPSNHHRPRPASTSVCLPERLPRRTLEPRNLHKTALVQHPVLVDLVVLSRVARPALAASEQATIHNRSRMDSTRARRSALVRPRPTAPLRHQVPPSPSGRLRAKNSQRRMALTAHRASASVASPPNRSRMAHHPSHSGSHSRPRHPSQVHLSHSVRRRKRMVTNRPARGSSAPLPHLQLSRLRAVAVSSVAFKIRAPV